MAFENGVAVPNFLAATPVKADTTWLAGLPNDFFAGQQAQRQLATQNAFANGLPLDANGQPDYAAAADRLIRLGSLDQGMGFLNAGLQRQGILAAQQAGAELANGGTSSGAGGLSGPMSLYGNAISSIESGGNYGAKGVATKTGDRAYGKYQVMGANVGPWTQEVLGQSMTPEQFLASPQAQDAVFNAKFGQYVKQTGSPGAAASMWFTGRPSAPGATDANGTTGQGYVDRFNSLIANGGQPSQQPYRVASTGPVAAPTRSSLASAAAPQPTANTATTQAVTPVEIGAALKVDPQQVADALGIDKTEAVDFNDTGIRQTLRAAFPTQTGGTRPAPATTAGATPAGAIVPDRQASNVHPFGPGANNTESGNTVAPAAAPMSSAPVSSSGVGDPSFGGMVPAQYQSNPGQYVSYLRGRAVQLAALPGGDKAAAGFNKQADGIENAIARSDITTPTMKDYQQAVRQGYQGSMMQFEADQAAQKASAEGVVKLQNDTDPARIRFAGQEAAARSAGAAQGEAPYKLVATQPSPGGPTVMTPEADILSGAASGVQKQPAYIAQMQENIGKEVSAMSEARQQRAVAQERLDAMSKLLEGFQTGAGAEQKAALIANARALNIQIPDSATGNPAAVEQFAKNATANIFSQAKSLGGKILVSELTGLQKSNANASMQPGSNAAIIAQQKGILDWQDAHDDAYEHYLAANPNTYDMSKFESDWVKQNPVGKYVADAKKNIAPLGMPLPPKSQLVDGQAYMVKGQKARWSASQNGFVPVTSP